MRVYYNESRLDYFLDSAICNKNAKPIIEDIEEFLTKMKEMSLLIKDRRKFTSEKFANIIEGIYTINLEFYDYLEIASKKFKKNFISYADIKTTMKKNVLQTEGRHHSFDCRDDFAGIDLGIMHTDEFEYHEKKYYTVDEITKLVENNTIFIISEMEEECRYDFDDRCEEYKVFEVTNEEKFLSKKGSFYKYVASFIRKKITTKRLINDYRRYLEQMKDDMRDITNYSDSDSYIKKQVAEECKEMFEKNGYYNQIEELLKDL